eukprot:gene7746-8365_t
MEPVRDSTMEAATHRLEREHGIELRLQDFAISIQSKPTLPFQRVTSDEKPFFIVHPFSTVVPGSSLFAILGGSGSGKTTLLNVL